MGRQALDERTELFETLRGATPDAPTLCTEWTVAQLTGHLVLRERSWTELLGRIPTPRAHAIALRHIDAYLAAVGYPGAVAAFAAGPPAWSPFRNPLVREQVNLLEYLIHHEDVRRAQPGWVPRVLPVQRQEAVWSRLKIAVRTALLAAPGVRLEWPGHGSLRVGRGGSTSVSGAPEELALYAFGRRTAALVE